MNRKELIDYCLAKPGAKGDFPFDERTLAIRVGGKIFALLDVEDEAPSVNLKCDPELAVDLRETYESIRPGYHMNKEHWNTVDLDGKLPEELLVSLVDRSYELVAQSLGPAARAAAGLPPKPRRAP